MNNSQSIKHSVLNLTHFGILKLSGKDAGKLLQGQITCNINDLREIDCRFAAICNPKGRAIATFLLVKNEATFYLMLPIELVQVLRKRLQMFVLRSEVVIEDVSADYAVICLINNNPTPQQAFSCVMREGLLQVSFPGKLERTLILAGKDAGEHLYSERIHNQGYSPTSAELWQHLDIRYGIPWLTESTSEEYVPQMLNLDKLGGISFNKGCYTGQEIVARTHYLGKNKRELFFAETLTDQPIQPNDSIIDLSSTTSDPAGKILQAANIDGHWQIQAVLKLENIDLKRLALATDSQALLEVSHFTYA